MKQFILIIAAVVLVGCTKEVISPATKPINEFRVSVPQNSQTRVGVQVDITQGDKTYWKEGDFLYVLELTHNKAAFTGVPAFKYDYSPSALFESTGMFKGTGITTGGSYLVVCTDVPSVVVPKHSGEYFSCTFSNNTVVHTSFENDPTLIQYVADNLLFCGDVTFEQDEATLVALNSPMSMIELRLTTQGGSDYEGKTLKKIELSSSQDAFSNSIYIDYKGDFYDADAPYTWSKLEDLDYYQEFVTGSDITLSATAFKSRFITFQAPNVLTAVTVTVTFNDGSQFTHTTPQQTRPLQPGIITIINIDVK